MSDTQSIETLRAEVEALKASKLEELKAQAEQRRQDEEEAELKRQLNDLKEGRLPGETKTEGPAGSRHRANQRPRYCSRSSLGLWSRSLLSPVLSSPVSLLLVLKSGCRSGLVSELGLVCLPFAAIDLGLLSSVPAAGVAVAAQASKTNKKRLKYGVTMPEQADSKMMKLMDF